MATYSCAEFEKIKNIYGSYDCKTWVENTNLLDILAITPVQAGQIAVAICSLFALGFVIGEIGNLIRKMGR